MGTTATYPKRQVPQHFLHSIGHCPMQSCRYRHRWPSLSKHVQAPRPAVSEKKSCPTYGASWILTSSGSSGHVMHARLRGIQKPWNGFAWDVSMLLFVAGFIWLIELMCLADFQPKWPMADEISLVITRFLMSIRIIRTCGHDWAFIL